MKAPIIKLLELHPTLPLGVAFLIVGCSEAATEAILKIMGVL